MPVLRTPEERFARLEGYPFPPRYTEIDGEALGPLRMHHVEVGASGDPVLCLHGEPTWSFLYRTMLPVFAEQGLRALAPDLVGFGKSDKPDAVSAFSYAGHTEWVRQWIEAQDLERITLVCQDWGSLIGLRLVAEMPERFARVVVANGYLPEGTEPQPLAFKVWKAFARWSPFFPVSRIVQAGCVHTLKEDARYGYDAPFPSRAYKAAARAFPRLVPSDPNEPGAVANRAAWAVLEGFTRPVLTAFASGDPIFRGADRALQKRIPGAHGQPHTTIRRAGHFVQEDRGPELARLVADFIAATPAPFAPASEGGVALAHPEAGGDAREPGP